MSNYNWIDTYPQTPEGQMTKKKTATKKRTTRKRSSSSSSDAEALTVITEKAFTPSNSKSQYKLLTELQNKMRKRKCPHSVVPTLPAIKEIARLKGLINGYEKLIEDLKYFITWTEGQSVYKTAVKAKEKGKAAVSSTQSSDGSWPDSSGRVSVHEHGTDYGTSSTSSSS